MLTFTFSIPLSEHIPFEDEKKLIEAFTGKIEAANYQRARELARVPIMERVKQLQTERGCIVGCGNLDIVLTQTEQVPTTLTLEEYQKATTSGKTFPEPQATLILVPLLVWQSCQEALTKVQTILDEPIDRRR